MMRFAVVAMMSLICVSLTNATAASPESSYIFDLRPTSQMAPDTFNFTKPGGQTGLNAPTTKPTAAVSSLIPPKDEFGLPGPVWLFEFLLPATFFLHVLFMNVTLGTALLAIPLTLLARRRPHVSSALHDLYSAWPVAMSLTITTGIAPLLFVQVLYGHFFFVSSILLGWWWLAILIALLAAFYGIYFAKAAIGHGNDPNQQTDRAPSLLHWLALSIVALACIFIAAMFTANSTLMLLPDAWKQVHEGRQFGWAVHPMFWPRLAHNLIGSLAVTGMFIAIRARLKRVHVEHMHKSDTFHLLSGGDDQGSKPIDVDSIVTKWNETRLKMITLGLLIALVATCVQVADGIWFVVTIFNDVVAAFHDFTPGTVLWGLAILASVALIVTLFKGLDDPERPAAVWLPAGLLAFILVGMSAGRERVRMGMLQLHAEKLYTEADVRPQTLTTILFFITLAAGLALIAIMARWMFTARQNEANLPS